jgi:hypothetical protein
VGVGCTAGVPTTGGMCAGGADGCVGFLQDCVGEGEGGVGARRVVMVVLVIVIVIVLVPVLAGGRGRVGEGSSVIGRRGWPAIGLPTLHLLTCRPPGSQAAVGTARKQPRQLCQRPCLRNLRCCSSEHPVALSGMHECVESDKLQDADVPRDDVLSVHVVLGDKSARHSDLTDTDAECTLSFL